MRRKRRWKPTPNKAPTVSAPDLESAAAASVANGLINARKQSIRLFAPVTPDVEEARAYVWEMDDGSAGGARHAYVPAEIEVPFTTDDLAAALPGTPRASLRRLASEMIAAGLAERDGPGEFRAFVRINWPDGNKALRWRYDPEQGYGVAW